MDGREEHQLDRRNREREAAEQAARESAIRTAQLGEDFAWLMADERGVRVVRHLLAECGWDGGVLRPVMHANYGAMCHEEGKRDIGRVLYRLVRTHSRERIQLLDQEQ